MRLLALVAALAAPATALLSNSSINSQIRLAYSGTTGMTVSWNTFQKLSNPTVHYGLDPHNLLWSASSTISVTYQSSLTYNNHVKITGLQPDTVYWYLPDNILANETAPGPYTFKTAKPAGDSDPYTIAFVCDLGTMGPEGLSDTSGTGVDSNSILKPGEQNTIQSLASSLDTFDFLVHPGDLAYADAWLKEEIGGYEPNTTTADGYKVYESILNGFYDEMEAITAWRPYMVGPGNHEANCDNGGTGAYTASICAPGQTNFTGYINHFRMPSDVSGGLGNFWYSFDYGQVHYTFFDTETDLGHGLLSDEPPSTENAGPFGLLNQQANWLANDLASVDRCKTPWVIALGHRPWFASGSNCANCSTAFAAVFEQYGVDLVLQGHFHVYERNWPVHANGTKDPNGYNNPSTPWYIINGIAGHYDGMDSFTYPLKAYQAFGIDESNSTYGWSRIHFLNRTHLKHEFVASNNNSVLDSTILFKNHTCSVSTTSTTSKSASTSATPTSSVSLVTSTVKTTTVITVTKCPVTVTNCPAESTVLVTSTIDLYTTVCPATEQTTSLPKATSTPAGPGSNGTYSVMSKQSTTSALPGGSGSGSGAGSSSTTSGHPAVVTAGGSQTLVSAAALVVAVGALAVLL